MTNTRNAGGAKGSSRSTSRARGNSTVKGVKQQTNLHKSVIDALHNALDSIPVSVNRTTGSPCGIKRLHAVLPQDLGDKVLMLIDTSGRTAVDIANALAQFDQETGVRMTAWIVQKHRRRMKGTGCSCVREVGKV